MTQETQEQENEAAEIVREMNEQPSVGEGTCRKPSPRRYFSCDLEQGHEGLCQSTVPERMHTAFWSNLGYGSNVDRDLEQLAVHPASLSSGPTARVQPPLRMSDYLQALRSELLRTQEKLLELAEDQQRLREEVGG